MPLTAFDPLVREWFEARFSAATEPQKLGWPEIRAGSDVLATFDRDFLDPSVDTRRKMSMLAAENAVAALAGRRPPNLLNPDAWNPRVDPTEA